MKFARVIGTVVTTVKYEGLDGVKFLVVQLLDEDLNPRGRPTIAADATAQAGPGELVFVVGSREAAQAMPEIFVETVGSAARNTVMPPFTGLFEVVPAQLGDDATVLGAAAWAADCLSAGAPQETVETT